MPSLRKKHDFKSPFLSRKIYIYIYFFLEDQEKYLNEVFCITNIYNIVFTCYFFFFFFGTVEGEDVTWEIGKIEYAIKWKAHLTSHMYVGPSLGDLIYMQVRLS